MFLYDEIFNRRSYLPPALSLPDDCTVIDIGANIGLFMLFAHLESRHARVLAMEPVPRLHEILTLNAARHAVNAIPLCAAAGSKEGSASMSYYPRNSILSSLDADAEEQRTLMRRYVEGQLPSRRVPSKPLVDALLDDLLKAERVQCRVRRLSDVIREQELATVDLLKVDVERTELEVLLGIDEREWTRIRQVVLEVHDISDRVRTVATLLQRQGFTCSVTQDPLLRDSNVHLLTGVRRTTRHRRQRQSSVAF